MAAGPEAAIRRRLHQLLHPRYLIPGVLALLVVIWAAPTVVATLSTIDVERFERPYLVIGMFVVFDAVIPVFPSESLLTAASTLIASDDSSLSLLPLIVAGALGAVIGDTILYWLARTIGGRVLGARVEAARSDPRAAQAFQLLGDSGALAIIGGRFIPGVRFIVGATMGIAKYPYSRFLLWDIVGASIWATYTCVFAYLVSGWFGDAPVLAFATSGIVSTALIVWLFVRLKRRYPAGLGADT